MQRSSFRQAELEVAILGVFGHLWSVVTCLFNFEFSGAAMELIWAVSRALRIGDYGKEGYFTKLIEREKCNDYDK